MKTPDPQLTPIKELGKPLDTTAHRSHQKDFTQMQTPSLVAGLISHGMTWSVSVVGQPKPESLLVTIFDSRHGRIHSEAFGFDSMEAGSSEFMGIGPMLARTLVSGWPGHPLTLELVENTARGSARQAVMYAAPCSPTRTV